MKGPLRAGVREIRVDPNVLGAALDVPDGVRIVGCRWDGNTKTILLSLESFEFEKVEKANEIPLYDVVYHVHWYWIKVPQEKSAGPGERIDGNESNYPDQ